MVTHCIHPHVHILPEREARFPVRITMRIMQYDNAFFFFTLLQTRTKF